MSSVGLIEPKIGTVDNKATFEEAAALLYLLERQKRDIEKWQEGLKGKMLTWMNANSCPVYSTDAFIVEKSKYVRYGVPEPAVLRQKLGDDAEHYIKEVVSPEVRLHLPPQLALKLCPVEKETEYVRLKLQEGKP
jgi:hypothetical protein